MATGPALLSCELDVWKLFPGVCSAKNRARQYMHWYPPQGAVRDFIYVADAELRAFLARFYSSDLTCTPVAGFPMPAPNGELANSTTGIDRLRLKAVTPTSSAVTEMWEIEFTSATAYQVYASINGAPTDSTGATDADYTAAFSGTDHLSIATADWFGTGAQYDRFFVSVHANDPYLAAISAKLAAATMLRAVYGNESPNESAVASQYMEQALESLRKLIDPEGGIKIPSLTKLVRDGSPIQQDYEVDRVGRDLTHYADFEWAPVDGGGTTYEDSVWASD